MVSLRTLCSHHLYTLLRNQNPSQSLRNDPISSSWIFHGKISTCPQLVSPDDPTEAESTNKDNNGSVKEVEQKGKKDLSEMEKGGAVLNKICKKNEDLKGGEDSIASKLKEIRKMKKKLQKLERELKGMKGGIESNKKHTKKTKEEETVLGSKEGAPATTQSETNVTDSGDAKISVVPKENNNSSDVKGSVVSEQERVPSIVKANPFKANRPNRKELSPEMVSLVSHWYEEGYFNNAIFLEKKKEDVRRDYSQYPRDFLRFTAERFGQDHQDIAKWLSGGNLKRVSLFGCPSLEKKSAFAAKRLRSFFNIQEDIVCRSCKLKSSCKHVNQKVWQRTDNPNLADVMRVLTSYELDMFDTQLAIPNDVKLSISKLLKEFSSTGVRSRKEMFKTTTIKPSACEPKASENAYLLAITKGWRNLWLTGDALEGILVPIITTLEDQPTFRPSQMHQGANLQEASIFGLRRMRSRKE